jgi:hypothetical protein
LEPLAVWEVKKHKPEDSAEFIRRLLTASRY